MNGTPFRVGCSRVAHRDVGLCAFCTSEHDEIERWRMLAIEQRGLPSLDEPNGDDVLR